MVKGTGLPDAKVLLFVHRRGALVANGSVRADEQGGWEFTFDEPFRNGRYVVSAQSQDARGALSLVVASPEIRVKSRPIIQMGVFQLDAGGAATLLLIILAAGCGGGAWLYKKRQEQLALRVGFAESEITKIFVLIRADVETLAQACQTPNPDDDAYAMGRLRENIQKMETYLKRGVEKIKK